jgi:hypothetical protein
MADHRSTVRYLLCPGYVKSKYDGDEHYIGAMRLARLYGVDPRKCGIFEPSWLARSLGLRLDERRYKDLIKLVPRYDGDYTLPSPSEEN